MKFFLLALVMINIYWFLIKSDYGRKGLPELYVCFGCKNNVQISYNMQKQIIELNSALANSCLRKEKIAIGFNPWDLSLCL